MDIISIAQQARPKDIGQIELRRAQFTTLSSDANKIPSSFRKFASCPGASSVTPFASSTAMACVAPCGATAGADYAHFACLRGALQRNAPALFLWRSLASRLPRRATSLARFVQLNSCDTNSSVHLDGQLRGFGV